MDVLKRPRALLARGLLILLGISILPGCQIGYIFKSAKNHFSIMSKRVSLEEALNDPQLPPAWKGRLKVAQEAHDFALNHVGLKKTDNYTTFVNLGRDYVTWVVSAAPRWKLEHHLWSYPVVGKMPYRGFADEDDAKAEAESLKGDELDVYLRGVSAYSTLGWFQDSILSSMLRSSEHGLVNTIIHETVHTTIYIKNSSDFNERLAVFVGNKAAEQFYQAREGLDSPTVKRIANENLDDRRFSDFIGPQIEALRKWYEQLPADNHDLEARAKRLKEIQQTFRDTVLPLMKTDSYKRFPEIELNNARLLYFKTYMQDLGVFEALFGAVDGVWKDFLTCAKTLETADKPEESLKELTASLSAKPKDQRHCR